MSGNRSANYRIYSNIHTSPTQGGIQDMSSDSRRSNAAFDRTLRPQFNISFRLCSSHVSSPVRSITSPVHEVLVCDAHSCLNFESAWRWLGCSAVPLRRALAGLLLCECRKRTPEYSTSVPSRYILMHYLIHSLTKSNPLLYWTHPHTDCGKNRAFEIFMVAEYCLSSNRHSLAGCGRLTLPEPL